MAITILFSDKKFDSGGVGSGGGIGGRGGGGGGGGGGRWPPLVSPQLHSGGCSVQ
jgi:hypothetical protein